MPYHLCYMLSYVNHHYLTLAARCPVSGCWPSCNYYEYQPQCEFLGFVSWSCKHVAYINRGPQFRPVSSHVASTAAAVLVLS